MFIRMSFQYVHRWSSICSTRYRPAFATAVINYHLSGSTDLTGHLWCKFKRCMLKVFRPNTYDFYFFEKYQLKPNWIFVEGYSSVVMVLRFSSDWGLSTCQLAETDNLGPFCCWGVSLLLLLLPERLESFLIPELVDCFFTDSSC